MARDVNPPRGMRDFLPADKAKREAALAAIRASYAAHGFDEIETPVLEEASRLHSGLGGDNEKLAFGVLRRGLGAEQVGEIAASGDLTELTDLGLRFDLTVPLARFYATHRAELPSVFKAIQIAPVWRAERPQKGRYRQFLQCDIDIIGEQSPLAEIELIGATIAALRVLGLTGCSIRLNDRRILRGLLASWNVPEDGYERALVIIDKEDKIGIDGVLGELRDAGLAGEAEADLVRQALAPLPGDGWGLLKAPPAWLDQDAYRDLLAIREAVATQDPDIPLVFAQNLVRGMGYYTGTIFEVAHPDYGYSLGGGGRYDGMVGRFLGTDVPACGFSLGFERIVDLIAPMTDAVSNAVLLVYDREVPPAHLLQLKSGLIDAGRRVRLEPRVRNLKSTLEKAAEAGYGAFAFVTAATGGVEDLELRPLGESRTDTRG